MQMSLFDHSLQDVVDMSGLERTHFMNEVYLDYQASKSLQQSKMEKFYLELLKQLIKDYGN
jgi:hypothetical protein